MIINNNPYNSQVNFGMKPPKRVMKVIKRANEDGISAQEAAKRIKGETGENITVHDPRGHIPQSRPQNPVSSSNR